MGDDLEERLKSHAKAFEGLMSLIPAKAYYAEDTSEQWQRKKQTKEERKNAKRAQLDPSNLISAQDLMDEQERKRKREMEGFDGSDSDLGGPGKEQPREGMKSRTKRPKLEESLSATAGPSINGDDEQPARNKSEKRREKALRKKERKAKLKEKAEAKQARHQDEAAAKEEEHDSEPDGDDSDDHEPMDDDDVPAEPSDDVEQLDVSGLVEGRPQAVSTASSSTPGSPQSVASINPSASSTSSIVPPGSAKDAERPRKIPKLPEADHEALKARLTARIEALRAARKADGIDGKPARTRQELLEARRRKDEQRKAHKKELRAKAKEEEQRKAAEAELARLRGSGSPNTPDIFSPRGEVNNFSFGRIVFDDGQQLDPSMTSFLDHKKKGPQDPKTALEAAEKKRARIHALDAGKRADIEEKDMWLNAKKRAHGEKVRDDISLLKKTLKKKQKAKQKSEREWTDRIEGVQKGKEARQRKREDNLKKRREEKGAKGKGKPKPKPAGKKVKSRPGFEGSFRAKAK